MMFFGSSVWAYIIGSACGIIATLDPATDGLRFEPTGPGDTLVFYNFDADGHNDPWSLHAGLEVDESEDEEEGGQEHGFSSTGPSRPSYSSRQEWAGELPFQRCGRQIR